MPSATLTEWFTLTNLLGVSRCRCTNLLETKLDEAPESYINDTGSWLAVSKLPFQVRSRGVPTLTCGELHTVPVALTEFSSRLLLVVEASTEGDVNISFVEVLTSSSCRCCLLTGSIFSIFLLLSFLRILELDLLS